MGLPEDLFSYWEFGKTYLIQLVPAGRAASCPTPSSRRRRGCSARTAARSQSGRTAVSRQPATWEDHAPILNPSTCPHVLVQCVLDIRSTDTQGAILKIYMTLKIPGIFRWCSWVVRGLVDQGNSILALQQVVPYIVIQSFVYLLYVLYILTKMHF